jgi:thymidylate kinase
MIINIAGTSGSGKSTLVRAFIDWAEKYGVVKPCYIDDRKEPIGYDVFLKHSKTIHLVGAYEDADTAGCDTIRDVVWIYDYIRRKHDAGSHVVYEGLFMMNMTRGPQLAAETNSVYVIRLSDPLAVCIASINKRRKARGEGPLLKKENTESNFKRSESYCDKMRRAGARVTSVKRAMALIHLVNLLGFDLRLGP